MPSTITPCTTFNSLHAGILPTIPEPDQSTSTVSASSASAPMSAHQSTQNPSANPSTSSAVLTTQAPNITVMANAINTLELLTLQPPPPACVVSCSVFFIPLILPLLHYIYPLTCSPNKTYVFTCLWGPMEAHRLPPCMFTWGGSSPMALATKQRRQTLLQLFA